jgi:hypothetical protein
MRYNLRALGQFGLWLSLARAPRSGRGGRGFESHQPDQTPPLTTGALLDCRASSLAAARPTGPRSLIGLLGARPAEIGKRLNAIDRSGEAPAEPRFQTRYHQRPDLKSSPWYCQS